MAIEITKHAISLETRTKIYVLWYKPDIWLQVLDVYRLRDNGPG